MLKSRLQEERRAATRETHRYDQLLVQFKELQDRHDKLIGRMVERCQASDRLQGALIARENASLRMSESYEGVVKHVSEDTVVVVFEADDDLLEQTYGREQFLDGKLPSEGDAVAAFVHLALLPHEEETSGDGAAPPDPADAARRRRKNVVKGPHEF